ncbi:MAG: ABC transporter ATP-binding protein [Planctomycetes bacterium]|nr:ABC transporter ATP-binding protein [Planctomycetota bacterium]
MIKTKGLTRKFAKLNAVTNVDLYVPRGTIFGFIGPNGAGKTTTMRMLATLLRPTSGSIEIDGVNLLENPVEVRGRIGYLSDTFGLYDELKAWEYLQYFCGAYNVDASRDRIHAILDLVQLTHKSEDFVGKLSRGMRQRLGIARMLVYDPKLILLDEPANGLDPMARIALRDLLKQLRARGVTVLVSSHILTELSDFCDTVGIMELGRMITHGSVEEILARTRTHLRLILEVLGPAEKAKEVLQGEAQVINLEVAAPGVPAAASDTAPVFAKLEMGFTGNRQDLPVLHKKLVEAGVPVVAFFPKAENLEDLFMRLSTGATN